MPTRVDYPIPPPSTWEAFENLCRDLWAEVWKKPNTQKHGRQGQPQNGVDVYCELKKNYWIGLQAKEKDQLPAKTLTVKELRSEVKKAKDFNPKLREYIVATTGPNDATVQEEARKITTRHNKKNLFSVTVYSWEGIESLIKRYPKIHKLHFPQHFPDLDAIETLTNKVMDSQERSQENTSKEISGVKLSVESGIKRLSEQLAVGGSVSQEYEAELNYSRDQIDQHKPATALHFLETTKNRIWNQATDNIKFRLLTNIAASKVQLGNYKEGALNFIEALQYNPNDEKAMCNVALAYTLLNRPQEAEKYINQVLQKNPLSSRANTILIQVHSDLGKDVDEIVKEIPSELLDNPEIEYGFGIAFRRSKQFKESQEWLKKALENKPEPEYQLAQATTLIISISKGEHLSFSKKLNNEEFEIVVEAAKLYETAWEKIKNFEDTGIKIECAANKGICFLLTRQLDKAALSFDDALAIEPDNPSYIFNRAYVDYESDKKNIALERLKKISQSKEIPAALLIGDIQLNLYGNNPEILKNETLPTIKQFILLNPKPFLKNAAIRQLIQVHIVLNELDDAKKIVDVLVNDDPQDINSLVSKSHVYRLLKNDKIADESLVKADNLIKTDTSFFDLVALADEYYAIHKYDKALNLYEKIADIKSDSDFTRNLIQCNLKTGNYQKALLICQSIRKAQGIVKDILRLEINLNEDIGNLKNAKKLCRLLLAQKPNDDDIKLELASIFYRNQELLALDKILKIPLNYQIFTLQECTLYAQLLSLRGLNQEAVDLMYETRRRYFDKSEAHLQYIATFFRSEGEDDSWLRPDKVSENTAVLIEDKNSVKTWYLIENRKDVDFAKNELRPDHSLAKRILNKKIDDEIELVITGPQKKTGRIIEIRSKYVYALHTSMNSFQTMFPDSNGLYSIQIGNSKSGEITEKDLEIIFKQVDEKQEHLEKTISLYSNRQITVGTLSKLLGKNEIEVWGLLINRNEPGFINSSSDVTLRKEAKSLLDAQPRQKIVIDIFALFTIHGIEIADPIISEYGKLLISQSTIDLITDLITTRKGLDQKGYLTLGKQGSQYIKEEISPDQLNKNTEYLKGLQAWIKKNCIVVPCQEALQLKTQERQKLYKYFGNASIDSILIAKQEKAVLFSDDEKLRILAKGTHSIPGVWTQIILESLLSNKKINHDKYQDSIIKLVNSNYTYTSINALTLIEVTKRSLWKADGQFNKFIKLLNGKNCDDTPAIVVVADYIQQLLSLPVYLDDPKNICCVILDGVLKDRKDPDKIIEDIKNKLRQVLAYSPQQYDEANGIIKFYKEMLRLTKSINLGI